MVSRISLILQPCDWSVSISSSLIGCYLLADDGAALRGGHQEVEVEVSGVPREATGYRSITPDIVLPGVPVPVLPPLLSALQRLADQSVSL